VQGILANTLAIVNGPPALQGVYVGTIASNSTSTVDWILGAAASGGTAARLALWNNFNRLPFSTTVTDSGALYTYSVATNREARASTGNQMTFVTGLVEDNEHFENCDKVALVGAVAATATWGFGLNSLTAFVSQPVALSDNAATATNGSLCASISLQAPIGLNVVSMQEIGDGTNANSFDDATLHYMSAVLNQ
jgi:hypothetical protein